MLRFNQDTGARTIHPDQVSKSHATCAVDAIHGLEKGITWIYVSVGYGYDVSAMMHLRRIAEN